MTATLENCRFISHRGRGFGFPENSRNACRAALASAAPEVEIDLYCQDGKFYASHWPLWTTRKDWLDDLETILSDFHPFAHSPASKRLRLDVKSAGSEELLVAAVHAADVSRHVTFMSRDINTLLRIRNADPSTSVSLSVVLSGVGRLTDTFLFRRALKRAPALAHEQDLSITLSSLFGRYNPAIIRDALTRVREVVVYVSSQEQAEALNALGVRTFLSKVPLTQA